MTLAASLHDAELLRAAQEGDQVAFALLYERYHRLVYTVAFRILGQPDDADDVCQEVFLQLHRRPPDLTGSKSLAPWLARVTANRAANVLRSRRRSRFYWLRWLRLDGRNSTSREHEFQYLETAALVRQVLERLPERDRVLLALRASGLSYEEIANALGLRLTSVGTLLARAERRFRQFYQLAVAEAEEVVE